MDSKVKKVHVYENSILIINQFGQEWKLRDVNQIPYQSMTLNLMN